MNPCLCSKEQLNLVYHEFKGFKYFGTLYLERIIMQKQETSPLASPSSKENIDCDWKYIELI